MLQPSFSMIPKRLWATYYLRTLQLLLHHANIKPYFQSPSPLVVDSHIGYSTMRRTWNLIIEIFQPWYSVTLRLEPSAWPKVLSCWFLKWQWRSATSWSSWFDLISGLLRASSGVGNLRLFNASVLASVALKRNVTLLWLGELDKKFTNCRSNAS